ncbi:MAG: hypothetical protein PHU04_02485 [Candidatus Peribacteraceae bacterium]|nr:hypothetical protein [Candidatus Peribacteraceae bacterium]
MRTAKTMGIISLCSLCALLIGCNEDLPPEERVEYEDVEAIITETTPEKHKVHGSCNVIASSSHCLDYIGSYWQNEEFMRLNCEGTGGGGGTFSKDACPYTEVGGCRGTADTIMETIMWAYNSGGSPITPEVAPYEQMACNANPAAQWVLPQF